MVSFQISWQMTIRYSRLSFKVITSIWSLVNLLYLRQLIMYFLNCKRQLDFLMKRTIGLFLKQEQVQLVSLLLVKRLQVPPLEQRLRFLLMIWVTPQNLDYSLHLNNSLSRARQLLVGHLLRQAQLLVIVRVLYRTFNNFLRMQMLIIQSLIFLRSFVNRL